jgi:ActR/RegA family two-component response regulator
LESAGQNVSKAAEMLDIDRRTLYRILKRSQDQAKESD